MKRYLRRIPTPPSVERALLARANEAAQQARHAEEEYRQTGSQVSRETWIAMLAREFTLFDTLDLLRPQKPDAVGGYRGRSFVTLGQLERLLGSQPFAGGCGTAGQPGRTCGPCEGAPQMNARWGGWLPGWMGPRSLPSCAGW